jgi:hypothetical protein
MEVSGQLDAPAALLPGKEAPISIGLEAWLGTRSGLDAVVKRKNLRPFRELNPGRPARSLVAVLTELPRLPIKMYKTII